MSLTPSLSCPSPHVHPLWAPASQYTCCNRKQDSTLKHSGIWTTPISATCVLGSRGLIRLPASASQALHKLSDKGIVEWAAFAATLAQRLARMLAAGLVSPAHQLWNLAVDRVLIKAVDADTQVGVGSSLLSLYRCTVHLSVMLILESFSAHAVQP